MGRRVLVTYECNAPECAMYENYWDIPEEIRKEIEEMDGLRCDGGFEPGEWCHRCKWGKVTEEEL